MALIVAFSEADRQLNCKQGVDVYPVYQSMIINSDTCKRVCQADTRCRAVEYNQTLGCILYNRTPVDVERRQRSQWTFL